VLNAPKDLVGGRGVKGSKLIGIMTYLQVIKVIEIDDGVHLVGATIPGSADIAVLLYPPGKCINLLGSLIAAHETYAGNAYVIGEQGSKGFNGEWLPHIVPKVFAMTTFATNGAATDTDGQGYLVGNLGKDFLGVYIL
jgi:hypothetical protein